MTNLEGSGGSWKSAGRRRFSFFLEALVLKTGIFVTQSGAENGAAGNALDWENREWSCWVLLSGFFKKKKKSFPEITFFIKPFSCTPVYLVYTEFVINVNLKIESKTDEVLVTQLCLAVCDAVDCNCQAPLSMEFPGKNTGVGFHSLLRGSSQPRNRAQVSCIVSGFFTV